MKFCKKLYLGEGTRKHRWKYIWKLKHHAGLLDIYVITLSDNPGELLEIYHNAFLMQEFYKQNPPFVVGIAKGKDEAMELVSEIIRDGYLKTGNYDIKTYLLEKQKGT
jgi:hypothetical protein